VLLTRENSERTTHVSVYLCGNYTEANHFCHFVNHLSLAGEDKLVARKITANAEHSLEKYRPPVFDDFIKIDDRTIQRVLREVEASTLAVALKDAKKEVKDIFLRNMSKRAASMLEEDIEYLSPPTESDIENARQLILDIYVDLLPVESRFDKAWTEYKNRKENNPENQGEGDNKNHMVLLFRGAENFAEYVSVYLFDEYKNGDNFCAHINNLKPEKGTFFYARYADQMTEYETAKPLLVSFDQVFKYGRLHDEYYWDVIIRDAIKKFSSRTILQAFKGMDKQYRMIIMQCLPTKTTDEITEIIAKSDKEYIDLCSLSESRKAQQQIINAINKMAKNLSKGEVLKD